MIQGYVDPLWQTYGFRWCSISILGYQCQDLGAMQKFDFLQCMSHRDSKGTGWFKHDKLPEHLSQFLLDHGVPVGFASCGVTFWWRFAMRWGDLWCCGVRKGGHQASHRPWHHFQPLLTSTPAVYVVPKTYKTCLRQLPAIAFALDGLAEDSVGIKMKALHPTCTGVLLDRSGYLPEVKQGSLRSEPSQTELRDFLFPSCSSHYSGICSL